MPSPDSAARPRACRAPPCLLCRSCRLPDPAALAVGALDLVVESGEVRVVLGEFRVVRVVGGLFHLHGAESGRQALRLADRFGALGDLAAVPPDPELVPDRPGPE